MGPPEPATARYASVAANAADDDSSASTRAGSRRAAATADSSLWLPPPRSARAAAMTAGPCRLRGAVGAAGGATTGDAQRTDQAQNPDSLAGKILRLTPEGAVPDDNPIPSSYVFSLGHRNPQGIVFDRTGQLWAAEFGQSTWDELNRIEPGANYGWPLVEGIGGRDGFVDPVQQWATSEASPSGLGIVGDTLFLAALRGQTGEVKGAAAGPAGRPAQDTDPAAPGPGGGGAVARLAGGRTG